MKETESRSMDEVSNEKGTEQDKLNGVQNKEKQDILDVNDKDNTEPKENQNPHKPCSLALLFNKLFPNSDEYYREQGKKGENIVKIRHFLNNLTPDTLNKVVKLPMSSKNNYQLIDNISHWEAHNNELINNLGLILPEKRVRMVNLSEERADDNKLFNFFNLDVFKEMNKQIKTGNAIKSMFLSTMAEQFLLKTKSEQKATQISFALGSVVSCDILLPVVDVFDAFIDFLTNITNVIEFEKANKNLTVDIHDILNISKRIVEIPNVIQSTKDDVFNDLKSLIKDICSDKDKCLLRDDYMNFICNDFLQSFIVLEKNAFMSTDKNKDFFCKLRKSIYKLCNNMGLEADLTSNIVNTIYQNLGIAKVGTLFSQYTDIERKNIDKINKFNENFFKKLQEHKWNDLFVNLKDTLNALNEKCRKQLEMANNESTKEQNNPLTAMNKENLNLSSPFETKKSIPEGIAGCCVGSIVNTGCCLFNTYSDCAELARNIKASFSKEDTNKQQKENVIR